MRNIDYTGCGSQYHTWQRFVSKLSYGMACYLHQYWHFINKVSLAFILGKFYRKMPGTYTYENIIAYPLMFIFNKAMEDATYPNRMKIAKVLALFKKNPKYVPENYRPISLSSSLDKIFEKIIYKRFSLFIEKHTILYLQQYGFRKKTFYCISSYRLDR